MEFGAGMGLPNMKKNVDQLTIESKVGKGHGCPYADLLLRKRQIAMEETKFYHALKIDNDRCVGCTHCMTKCPTGAIRIREGKASIRKGWCVDCGECLKACPTEAIYVEQDDFQKIFDDKARVVLVSDWFYRAVLQIYDGGRYFQCAVRTGLYDVFQVEFTADMIHREMLRQMELAEDKPVISSFCPVYRPVDTGEFPALAENILFW